MSGALTSWTTVEILQTGQEPERNALREWIPKLVIMTTFKENNNCKFSFRLNCDVLCHTPEKMNHGMVTVKCALL
jgi:hypothetical protein